MPTRPVAKSVNKMYSSIGILQSIFSDPNNDLLYNKVEINNTLDSIKQAGQFITALNPRCNQFINALVNRIGMVRIEYLMWTNPWSWAKQGKLEMGETVEQIWLGLATAFPYTEDMDETRVLKKAPNDVLSAFHRVNYRVVYEITVNIQDLKAAFLSYDGLMNFVESIIASTGRSANVDEFAVMKYTLATALLQGYVPAITIPTITKANASDVVTTIKGITNALQFPIGSVKYNRAGVENVTLPEDTFILESTTANAMIEVNSLANAFNVDYVKFMGHIVMHDGLGNYNWARMKQLFLPGEVVEFTADQIGLLNSVELIVMDRKFLQIYDNYEYMDEPFRNGAGLYQNYFYHVGKVLSTSPFHNCIAFTTSQNGAITVTLSPLTASVSTGQSVILQATVDSVGFQILDVIWDVSGNTSEKTFILNGILNVGDDETAKTLTVKATSVADSSKSATSTITVVTAT